MIAPWLAALALLAAPSRAEDHRPESWCRYLYDTHAYSWKACRHAVAVPDILLAEAAEAADERKWRVGQLADELKKAETADDVRAALTGFGLTLKPELNDRTFSAWLDKDDLDAVQEKLKLYMPKLKLREPLVVDATTEAASVKPAGPDTGFIGMLEHMDGGSSPPEPVKPGTPRPPLREPSWLKRLQGDMGKSTTTVDDGSTRWLEGLRRFASPAPAADAPASAEGPAAEPQAPSPNEAACADFYDYACGDWDSAHARWSRRDQAAAIAEARLRGLLGRADSGGAGDFYVACARASSQSAGLQALKDDLARLAALRSKAQLPEELARLQRLGVDAVFAVDGVEDPVEPSETIASLDLAPASQAAADTRRAALTLVRFGEPLFQAQAEASAAAALERALTEARTDAAPRRLGAEAVEQALRPFGWRRYMASLGASPASAVLAARPDALPAIAQAFERQPLAAWSAYLRWRLIESKAWLLPDDLAADVSASGLPRWRACLRGTLSLFPDASAQLYSDAFVPAHERNRAAGLANGVKLALQRRMNDQAWLSAATRQEALRKLSALSLAAAPAADAAPPVDRGDALADDYALERASSARRFAAIGAPAERPAWSAPLSSAAAVVDRARVALEVSPALLQPPFLDPAADPAADYGGLGALLADAMADAVAGDGRHSDADGRPRDWWPAYDVARFELKAQCLPGGGALDDLGVRAAYDAYAARQDAASPGAAHPWDADQRFFLAYARSRCGSEDSARLNAVVSNLSEFRRAFQCPTDAAMTSAQRCQVW